MKYFISLFILSISINCYSETNRQILEDIRDEIEFMQYQQELRDIERLNRARQNVQDIQIEREKWERENRAINEMLAKQKLEIKAAEVKAAKLYGLTMSEYSRRWEIVEAKCPQKKSDPSYFSGYCNTSIMLNISYAEAERRSKRFVSLCKERQDSQKEKCFVDIVVMNK
jgi:hypothetical protein